MIEAQIAECLAHELKRQNVTVFYDMQEKARLWGKDLYQFLTDLYSNRARYCVILCSVHYARKLWTRHELKAAQARAFSESEEYILPVQLDDTEIPGILPTVGFLRIPPETIKSVAGHVLDKLHSPGMMGRVRPIPKVQSSNDQPRSQQLDLIIQHSLSLELRDRSAEGSLLETGRLVFRLIVASFLENLNEGGPANFSFLLFLYFEEPSRANSGMLHLGLTCHITPFVDVFAQRLSEFFGSPDDEGSKRAILFGPEDLRIKMSYRWSCNPSENIAYRIKYVGPRLVTVNIVEGPVVVAFPLTTSRLLEVLASKGIVYDDVNFADPQQTALLKFMRADERNISMIKLRRDDPEQWDIPQLMQWQQ